MTVHPHFYVWLLRQNQFSWNVVHRAATLKKIHFSLLMSAHEGNFHPVSESSCIDLKGDFAEIKKEEELQWSLSLFKKRREKKCNAT